jgi:hypothetical protein
VATTASAVDLLKEQHQRIIAANVSAELLSATECNRLEPLLSLPTDGLAMRVHSDAQLDARQTAQYLLHECQCASPGGRFQLRFGTSVTRLLLSRCTGGVAGVETEGGNVRCRYLLEPAPQHSSVVCCIALVLCWAMQFQRTQPSSHDALERRATLHAACSRSHFVFHLRELTRAMANLLFVPATCCFTLIDARTHRRGVVIAMGCASGQIVYTSVRDALYRDIIQPRCGFLVETPYLPGMQRLRHGIMEAAYTKHYAKDDSCEADGNHDLDITFTASSGPSGTLLVGARPPCFVCFRHATVFLPAADALLRFD